MSDDQTPDLREAVLINIAFDEKDPEAEIVLRFNDAKHTYTQRFYQAYERRFESPLAIMEAHIATQDVWALQIFEEIDGGEDFGKIPRRLVVSNDEGAQHTFYDDKDLLGEFQGNFKLRNCAIMLAAQTQCWKKEKLRA